MYYGTITPDMMGPTIDRIARMFPEMTVRSLQRSGRESKSILALTTRSVRPWPPIDTGAYLRSWHSMPRFDGADVFNDAHQASVMEEGARAYMISEEGRHNLVAWVMRKARPGSSGRRTRTRRGTTHRKASAERMRTLGTGGARHFSKTAFGGKIHRANQRYGMPGALAAAERISWSIAWKYAHEGIEGRHVLGLSWPRIVRLVELNFDEDLRRFARW